MYTTLGYIVSLILLNLGHVFAFRIVSRMWHIRLGETRVPNSRGSVKQYNQELCMYIFNYKMFHQEASVETIKMTK